jgi:alpha-galactosidase
MKASRRVRRKLLQLASGLAAGGRVMRLPLSAAWVAAPRLAGAQAPAGTAPHAGASLGDEAMRIEYDLAMHSRVLHAGAARGAALASHWGPAEFVELADGRRIERFALREKSVQTIDDPVHGKGRCLHLAGVAAPGLEKSLEVCLFERYPGFALQRVAYRNLSAQTLHLGGWTNGAYGFGASAGATPDTWSYSGGTYPDRRDWVQPLKDGFAQENFQGMTGSDYGGGTPIVDLWRREGGFAVGHVETVPHLVSLPLRAKAGRASFCLTSREAFDLAPGARFQTPQTFVAVHRGDYFATLDTYRRVMAERGLRSPEPPSASYEPVWCAWGYERECTAELIEGTLAKAKDLGLDWAGIDDGWQEKIGDWGLDPRKYPRGEADMKRLVARIREQGLKPRLWFSPLSVAPGSDLLHDHPDMLLLDANGAQQEISWWNTFTLCPAYQPTVTQAVALVRKFIGEWGFAGLKLDGQHLNGVAPCFNPAHRHARPQESVEKLHDFYRAIYEAARAIDPQVVVELCPCGTSFAFHNFPYMNHAPASDPESAWQVRHKGKTLKALMGPSAPYAGDHVELTPGDDFASTVGIGAVVSTKFTWPTDPKPKDSFLLTPEKEQKWRKWIGLYREKMLPRGTYRGELYDIAFDKPETHVIESAGRTYYAFYAKSWRGPVALRGLEAARYRVRDYFNDVDLGHLAPGEQRIDLAFEGFLLLEALPA